MSTFVNSNDYLTGRKPALTPAGGESVATHFTLAMTTADLDSGDIGKIAILPAGCVPVSLLFDSDALAASGLALSVGVGNLALKDAAGAVSADLANTLISTTAADGGAAWGTAISTAIAGGQAAVVSKALSRVTAVNYDRYIVLSVTTAATTPAAGTLGLTMTYRAAPIGGN